MTDEAHPAVAASLRDREVSCLMVSLPVPQRWPFFLRSVDAYCRQTHPNRELVIVLNQGAAEMRAAARAHVALLGRDDIRVVERAGQCSLGALRNVSLDSARGEFVCQWDDDDLHHPQRVERQLAALVASGAEGSCLEEIIQYFPATRALHCINFRATAAKAMPGSLTCRRAAPIRYPESGPESRLGEDSVVAAQLARAGGLHAFGGAPHLFVYVSHGANTWPDDHHRMLARELSVSSGLLRRREAQLRAGLAPFDFGPGEIAVHGYNGVAFTLGAASASAISTQSR